MLSSKFQRGVFEDGRSNGGTFGFQKSKMAAGGYLDYTKISITLQPSVANLEVFSRKYCMHKLNKTANIYVQ